MALVWIPALMRDLTGGQARLQAPGETVRQVIGNLDSAYPGVKDRLFRGDDLAPYLSVFVDGERAPLGMSQPVGEQSEVHFVAVVGGG